MTSEEYRDAIEALGLTPKGAARFWRRRGNITGVGQREREWAARAGVALPALPHRRRSDAARSDRSSDEGQRAVIRARLPAPWLVMAPVMASTLSAAPPLWTSVDLSPPTKSPASREAAGLDQRFVPTAA